MPATVKVGMPLIVGDEELEEEYVADLLKNEGYHPSKRNPIVKIRFVLRYPIQHAIVWTDIPHENRAVDEGVICRLHFFRMASPEEVSRFSSYAESLKAAQEQALFNALQEKDSITVDIIINHMRGEYRRPRFAMALKRWEI